MTSTDLVVQQSAKIIPLPQAIVWHEMAQQILVLALTRAQKLGVLTDETCFHIRTAAKKLDTFHIRAVCTLVLDKIEQRGVQQS